MNFIVAILAGALLVGDVSQQPTYQFVDDHYELFSDIGGDVRAYAMHFAMIQKTGVPVHVLGDCLSACTLVLKNKSACAGPHARFGFHLAKTYNRETREVLGISDAGNTILWQHYPVHVKQRLGTLPERMVYVPGTDLIKPCPPPSNHAMPKLTAPDLAPTKQPVEPRARVRQIIERSFNQ